MYDINILEGINNMKIKKVVIILLVIWFILFVVSCSKQNSKKDQTVDIAENLNKFDLLLKQKLDNDQPNLYNKSKLHVYSYFS